MKTPTVGRGRRRPGAEFRVLGWLIRHPLVWLCPVITGVAVAWAGPVAVGITAGTPPLVLLVWARAHPDSWQRYGAPRLRSRWRRWTAYRGTRWNQLCQACDLARSDRRTGHMLAPRLVRLSSPTPTIDRAMVRLAPGQSPRVWEERSEELRHALRADGIGMVSDRPGFLSLTVIRSNPFPVPVPATEIPAEAGDVDLHAVELGDTEYGTAWTENLYGQHLFVVGATGSGKGSLIWNPLRAIGPAVRDNFVKVWGGDPKGGMEMGRATLLLHRFADHMVDTGDGPQFSDEDTDRDPGDFNGCSVVRLVTEFRDAMRERQRDLAAVGLRKFRLSQETPANVLVLDELAMMTALADRTVTSFLERTLAEIATQGRAAGFWMWAYVQEPTKEIVGIRDLFTIRIALRTTTDSHVDMALGDGALKRGALCHEIPADPEFAGIGYRVDQFTRQPQRVRAGHVDDVELDELVQRCRPRPDNTPRDAAPGATLRRVA